MMHAPSDRSRHLLAVAAGAGLMLLLLLLVTLDDQFNVEPREMVELRNVQMYSPPPPPPPPPVQQDAASASTPDFTIATTNDRIELEVMELAVELDAGDIEGFGNGVAGVSEGLGMDWGTVGLSDLDGVPMVVSSPLFVFPEEATSRNIDEFRVVFHIVIDADGKVYPVRVVENPFPSAEDDLMEYAADVRFSPPTRLGVPVRTQYLWPVLFSRAK